jgi:2-keto-4-pentenoate hydratase
VAAPPRQRTDAEGEHHQVVDQDLIADLASRLWRAEVDRTPIEPPTTTWPDLSIEQAYAVQRVNVARRVAAGAVPCGHKVGKTSSAWQQLLGGHEPTFGTLLDDMIVDEHELVEFGELVQPRVEAEIAFVMAEDLTGPGITTIRALGAIGGALPAIEVVDSRIVDWRIDLADTVADNASSARLVLGGRLTPVTALDLPLIGVLFFRNGAPIDSGAGAAALGNPARCVAWLANRLATLGSGLRRGDLVLSGALHRMVPARPGDVFQARFAHLGSVTTQFSPSSGGPVAP